MGESNKISKYAWKPKELYIFISVMCALQGVQKLVKS